MSDNSVSLLGKIAGYTEILAKDPQSTVFVSLCEAYRQLGMLDDALEIAQKGTRKLAAFSPGFVALGRIQAQQGDLAAAANSFEKALAIEKDSLAALKGLARTRHRQGHLDKAKDLLLRAQILNPQDPVVLKMLDTFPPVSGSAVSAVPKEPPVSMVVDESSSQASNESSVDSSEEPRTDVSPIPTATLADLYLKQGLFNEAANIYRDILRQDPGNEQARAKLVDLKKIMSEPGVAAGTQESFASVVDVNPEPEIVGSPEPVVTPVSMAQPGFAGTDGGSALDVYQRWLIAIEQRRAHVC